nr:MAG TPA: hypothetical protein [Caudoviricetes sp.]
MVKYNSAAKIIVHSVIPNETIIIVPTIKTTSFVYVSMIPQRRLPVKGFYEIFKPYMSQVKFNLVQYEEILLTPTVGVKSAC